MNFYIYPDNLKSAPMLFLWRLKDLAVIGTGALISVFALSQTGITFPIVITVAYGFLAIRYEDTSILVARSVDCLLNLSNSTRYRRVNVCRYESGALCDELSDLYGVALGNNRFGRSTDVLCDRNHYLLGQFYSFDRISF